MTQPGEVGYWRPVVDWCLGANDHFGTCFLAMVGNHHVIVTTANGAAEVMTDGEIERVDSSKIYAGGTADNGRKGIGICRRPA